MASAVTTCIVPHASRRQFSTSARVTRGELSIAVTAAALYACVVLHSRALLLTTVIAMLGFIGYFSGKYFAHSLGWPVTLVLMGVAFLGIGTLAIKVKKRI